MSAVVSSCGKPVEDAVESALFWPGTAVSSASRDCGGHAVVADTLSDEA